MFLLPIVTLGAALNVLSLPVLWTIEQIILKNHSRNVLQKETDIRLHNINELPVEDFKKISLERVEEIRKNTGNDNDEYYHFLISLIQNYANAAPEKCGQILKLFFKNVPTTKEYKDHLFDESIYAGSTEFIKFFFREGVNISAPQMINSILIAIINNNPKLFEFLIAHNVPFSYVAYGNAINSPNEDIASFAELVDDHGLNIPKPTLRDKINHVLYAIINNKKYSHALFQRLHYNLHKKYNLMALEYLYGLYQPNDNELCEMLCKLDFLGNKKVVLSLKKHNFSKDLREYLIIKNFGNFSNYYDCKITYQYRN